MASSQKSRNTVKSLNRQLSFGSKNSFSAGGGGSQHSLDSGRREGREAGRRGATAQGHARDHGGQRNQNSLDIG